jgi:hypothetical protein
MTDWLGIGISVLIIFGGILIIIAKVQGDRVVDVMQQFVDFMKSGGGVKE